MGVPPLPYDYHLISSDLSVCSPCLGAFGLPSPILTGFLSIGVSSVTFTMGLVSFDSELLSDLLGPAETHSLYYAGNT